MKYRTRTFYSETQKAMMWDRWRQGESLHVLLSCLTATITPFEGFFRRQAGYVHRKEFARVSHCRC